jgi:hypothetical protein
MNMRCDAMRGVEIEMCQFVLTLNMNTVVGLVNKCEARGPNKRATLVFFFFFVSSFVDAFSVNFSGASSDPVKSSLFQRSGQRN